MENFETKNALNACYCSNAYFAHSLLLIQVPRFALVGFSLAQLLMIMAALTYVSHHESLAYEYGPALVGAFALNYTGVAVSLLRLDHNVA
jgi:hypothetical protein